jgi:hypothetical protein
MESTVLLRPNRLIDCMAFVLPGRKNNIVVAAAFDSRGVPDNAEILAQQTASRSRALNLAGSEALVVTLGSQKQR